MREIGDRTSEGTILSDIGVVYGELGQYEEALGYLQQALAIRREVGDRTGEGATLNEIGVVYETQGQYGQALDYLQQALVI
jgi:tetratricopeptide (TPR) repeat protein